MRPLPTCRPFNFYGSLAFGCVTLACFSQFAIAQNIQGAPWRVVVSFILGALYSAVVLLDGSLAERFGEVWRPRCFIAACVLVTALIYVSPLRGFFGILVLPLLSQAIISYSWRRALAVGVYLYVATIGVFVFSYGMRALPESSLNYLTAFAFTAVFTAMTKQAQADREKAERLSGELAAANRLLHEQARQTEELATTRERNRLAREIHDGVGHYLTVVKTQLDVAAALMPSQPEKAREAVEKAAKLTFEALEDVRRSVGTLRTDTARPALTDSLRQLTLLADPPAAVSVLGTPRPLSAAAEHALYRVTQEGLTNIRKHARATSAGITLDFRDAGRVRLVIADNGCGTIVPEDGGAPAPGGFGLRGLRERVEILGGKLDAATPAGGGFALQVDLPA